MKMILHILLKDFRRHWMEMAGYLLVCASWAWQVAHPSGLEWMRQRELIPIAFFALWIILTIRLVQGECLVGDREWWPTRPYRWPLLMAAKALAMVLCLNLPLLIAQLYLLHHAGFSMTWALVPGLVILQGTLILFVTFPTAVLASITASIMQWVIVVVGLIIAGITLSWIPWSKLPDGLSGGEDVASWIGFGIVVPAMVLAIVWQFARRRETPARWLLGISLWSRFRCASTCRRLRLCGASPIRRHMVRTQCSSRFLRTGRGRGSFDVRIREVNRPSVFPLWIVRLIRIRL
jgi:hypothetical protein